MRLLLSIGAVMLVACLAVYAGSGEGYGGGTWVIPDPGYCWGGGVIPGVPPDFCWGEGVIPEPPGGYWGITSTPGGPEVGVAFDGGGGAEGLSSGLRGPSASATAEQGGLPAQERHSQMYIPPTVWRWVIEHPVRAR